LGRSVPLQVLVCVFAEEVSSKGPTMQEGGPPPEAVPAPPVYVQVPVILVGLVNAPSKEEVSGIV
jgi:hypothetical protein